MISAVTSLSAATAQTLLFVDAVRAAGFSGEFSHVTADRLVQSTDNSVYQVAPDAILFPRCRDDLSCVARVLASEDFRDVVLRPRGGGTGTTGASLGAGISVDFSRFMNRIVEINAAEGWVRVQAGVVKDQLNAALKPHGLFFAPELSPSNRATIGGMISTDACGQGSVIYGKTSDHVLELEVVLSDGTAWSSRKMDDEELSRVQARDDIVGRTHRTVDRIQRDNAALIAERFPKLNRSLTGYDLAHIRDQDGAFSLNSVLCGSEGTLALIAEAKLNVLKVPRASILVAIRYRDFITALRDAQELMKFGAASIETVDSMVLDLARGDNIWASVGRYFPDDLEDPVQGINLVEFRGDSEGEVEAAADRMTARLDEQAGPDAPRLGYCVATGDGITQIWEMRKRAVGLLGNGKGRARPVPFIEDCAVPPERLADFVGELRQLLDRHELQYGMYGHVDAGVLHCRPALDLVDAGQEHLIRDLSELVVALTGRYGGLLWGEHGKGVRSEFVPKMFGPLYPCLVEIKQAFDPRDQLNPGKIASSNGAALLKVDSFELRGQHDRVIPDAVRPHYDGVLSCNGNGACFNYDFDDVMCPSWKATRERRHSPKGRAGLLREWLRLLAVEGIDPVAESERIRRTPAWRGLLGRWRNTRAARAGAADFSHQVKEALDGCLACNACAGQCPVKVSIPTFRAKFFEIYHSRYARPVRDHLVAAVESGLPLLARVPGFYNRLVRSRLVRAASARIGLVDTPLLSGIDLGGELARRGLEWASAETIEALDEASRKRSIVLVQDAFTSFLETGVVLDLIDLLVTLGYRPLVAPYLPTGTPLHVLGFLGRFGRVAARKAAQLDALARTGVDLVGIDPAMTSTYRTEYRHALEHRAPRVQLPQEWLASRIDELPQLAPAGKVRLLPHCTERAIMVSALPQWVAIFARFGLDLEVMHAGCCGMAGNYGHEVEHLELSRQIYADSWEKYVSAGMPDLTASGFSCRAQARRFGGVDLPHPVQVLLKAARSGRQTTPTRHHEMVSAG